MGHVRISAVFLVVLLVFAPGVLGAQGAEPIPAATCFVFIDTQFIWTLEMVLNPYGRAIPILNIITLARGEWDFRPDQVILVNPEGRTAEVERFSMNTGVEDEPYLTNYLKVLGNSFIGVDLIGELEDFKELREAGIELGDNLFSLAPVHPAVFESLASKINQINVDSPDIREDYRVLGISFFGKRERAERGY